MFDFDAMFERMQEERAQNIAAAKAKEAKLQQSKDEFIRKLGMFRSKYGADFMPNEKGGKFELNSPNGPYLEVSFLEDGKFDVIERTSPSARPSSFQHLGVDEAGVMRAIITWTGVLK